MTSKIRRTPKTATGQTVDQAKGDRRAAVASPPGSARTTKTVTTISTVTTTGGADASVVAEAPGTDGKKRWAYAYQIIPPQAEDRLKAVRALIEKEMAEAKKAARTWQGRFIPEQLITHLLVVSDTPDQAGEMNRRLESALTELQTTFVRTTPFAIDDGVELGAAGSKLSPLLAPLVAAGKKKSG